jgi:hypothetical protein
MLLATVLTAAVAPGAQAQAACLTQPNRQAPEGMHWSLHYDRGKNQRCWVLVDGTGAAPQPQAQPAASSGLSTLQAIFGNFTAVQLAPGQAAPTAPAANPARKPAAPRIANAGKPEHPAVRTDPKGDPKAEPKADPASHQMSQPERDKLFEEFLRWHESQKITGTNAPR